jgi:hypothetical protein
VPYEIPLVNPRAYLVKKAVRRFPAFGLPEPSVKTRSAVTRHVVDSLSFGALLPASRPRPARIAIRPHRLPTLDYNVEDAENPPPVPRKLPQSPVNMPAVAPEHDETGIGRSSVPKIGG